MADKKMTVAEKLMAISAELETLGSTLELDGQSFADFLKDRAEKSVKKSSGVKKLSAEKVTTRARILEVLKEQTKPVTCTEIVKAFGEKYGEYVSTSLISGNLKPMIEVDGTVIKGVDGKSSVFSIAPTED